MTNSELVTDAVLRRLLSKGLSVRERRNLLLDSTDPDLLRDMLADKLNRNEQPIVMALALDWPGGRATAMDLSKVTGMRVSPRRDASKEGERPEPDVVTQLTWLERKEWVREAGEDPDGWPYWELVPEDEDDA